MSKKTDIEIAQECKMQHITEIAKLCDLPAEYLEQYGNYKAKIDYNLLKEKKNDPDAREDELSGNCFFNRSYVWAVLF